MKKIQKPKINVNLEIIDNVEELLQLIEDDEKIFDKLIENIDIPTIDESRVSFDSCVFRNVNFENCTFRYIDLMDVTFEKCDLSNIDFSEGSIFRTEFVNCKMIGSKIEDAHLKDCLFKNILGDYSSFAFSKLNKVSFESSSFASSIFMEVKNKYMNFDDCNFKKSVFTKTYLEDVNLSNCEIDGIEIGIPELYKVKVNASQGLELVKLIGLIVE
ncbi:MAG: pentapeptide repeat-containing protein [Clostridiales bacterium]|uniref:pentapeptide repeat-containing protein n=1 Tax=Terrisporobacter sp. TaxID=1965305 RepID=UPI002A5262E9|nr:pentapeptide repeat-containing protein [Terrisporobacter sp.]MCI5629165.1 pentapeptide repeat-containing protein [Clostridium sp.]MDD7754388.1 pentapeptide repeat-containing protein [Clostridiales bacterium]MCI6458077.1 pentapeptide repeat-containing protein [Clostridium sp.]MCI7206555.1 pentapeptide repeat-containing protein [Clostridium sp.]MDY4137588.1 pentapeptide repeat-containing protein [Terrisporobacter sp.]